MNAILVIKLGALGDFILAQAAFAAIRSHHPDATITLLTTAPFRELAERSGYFDAVVIDTKPDLPDLAGLLRLRRFLKSGGFGRVYDLQTSRRTALYYKLFWPGPVPEWSGVAPRCSHPDPTPVRSAVHAFDLRLNQLRAAGIEDVGEPDLAWMQGDMARFGLPERFALLAPGCAPHRPEKRWPILNFAGLAIRLAAQGMTPVVIGSAGESDLARTIAAACPDTIDLAGQTSLFDLADLAREARLAVGNDTGPMHLIAAIGCRSTVLFSSASDPAHSGPRGKAVTILQCDNLADLPVSEVEKSLLDAGQRIAF